MLTGEFSTDLLPKAGDYRLGTLDNPPEAADAAPEAPSRPPGTGQGLRPGPPMSFTPSAYEEPNGVAPQPPVGPAVTGPVVPRRGAHDVDPDPDRRWRRALAHDLLLAHLPFRNLARFKQRSANVRADIDAAPERYIGRDAWQWQRFARMDQDDRTREEFERQVVDAAELARLVDGPVPIGF